VIYIRLRQTSIDSAIGRSERKPPMGIATSGPIFSVTHSCSLRSIRSRLSWRESATGPRTVTSLVVGDDSSSRLSTTMGSRRVIRTSASSSAGSNLASRDCRRSVVSSRSTGGNHRQFGLYKHAKRWPSEPSYHPVAMPPRRATVA
jgi:hypothetical protein